MRKNKRMRPKSLTGKTCQKWKQRIVVTEFSDEKLFVKMIFIFPSLIYFNICNIHSWVELLFSFTWIFISSYRCCNHLCRQFVATIFCDHLRLHSSFPHLRSIFGCPRTFRLFAHDRTIYRLLLWNKVSLAMFLWRIWVFNILLGLCFLDFFEV